MKLTTMDKKNKAIYYVGVIDGIIQAQKVAKRSSFYRIQKLLFNLIKKLKKEVI